MPKGTKAYSDRQEKLIARYLNWKQVSGSGARPLQPGDVICDEWLGECKTYITSGHPIIFKFDVWDKLEEEAISQFKTPALFVDDGSQTIDSTFVLIEVPNGIEIDGSAVDYSDKKSFRFNSKDFFESTKIAKSFKRNDRMYCVMWLPQFSTYLRYENL